jgi:cytochrome P450
LIAQRHQEPRRDLLSDLIAVEEHGDRLSHGELLSMCNLLLAAGHETTTNLLATGTLSLLQHPDQWRLLQERPELLPGAVEELLRFETPVQRLGRVATESVAIGGQAVAAGEPVAVVLAAANRDGTVFPDPARLDVARRPNHHLAFGHDIHFFCLGAPLARLEGRAVLGTLLRRFPRLELAIDAPPEWAPNTALRGLARLPVRLS